MNRQRFNTTPVSSASLQRALGLLLFGFALSLPLEATAQSTRALDAKAEQLREEFVRETGLLAEEYERAGDSDKAVSLLRQILDIRPDLPKVRDRIKEIQERRLSENVNSAEVDVSKGWIGPIVAVQKGQAFRLSVSGDYRLIYNATLTPDGATPSDDITSGMVGGIPFGKLMAVVIDPSSGNQNQPGRGGRRGGQKNQPEPFVVGSEAEISPENTGLLYLRVNVPANSRATGKLKVTLSGNVTAP